MRSTSSSTPAGPRPPKIRAVTDDVRVRESPMRRLTVVEHEESALRRTSVNRSMPLMSLDTDVYTQDTKVSPTSPRRLPRPPGEIPLQSRSAPLEPLPNPPYQRRSSNHSASKVPIVPGLSDNGPYPSTSMTQQTPRQPPRNVGLGRPSSQLALGKGLQQQEEVCLECMMRDRDLADVDVQGEGVWERESDLAWEDKKEREASLLRIMSTGQSLDSHHDPNDTEEARRRQEDSARMDQRIAREIGWRGFKWEEGNGEGLPRGFTGTKGGPLSEQAIKAVMTKVSIWRVR
jgi:hypothetical protein